MQHSDRTYHFIADPCHKENLSGRVTAACLNCRRKKVKCSGEINCHQCQEKGLECEGPPSRKRPRREQGSSSIHGTISVDEQRPQAIETSSSARHQLKVAARLHNEDSGYASSNWDSHQSETPSSDVPRSNTSIRRSAPAQPHDVLRSSASGESPSTVVGSTLAPLKSPFAFNNLFSHHDSIHDLSPRTMNMADWSFVSQGNGSVPAYHNILNAPSDTSHSSSHLPSAQIPSGSMDWSSRRGSDGWWSGGSVSGQSSKDLISAAEDLEEHAKTLRRLASQGQSNESQTMVSPVVTLSSRSANVSGAPILTFYGSALRASEYQAPALYTSDGTLHSGHTPNTNEFATWWDSMGNPLQTAEHTGKVCALPSVAQPLQMQGSVIPRLRQPSAVKPRTDCERRDNTRNGYGD